MVQTSKYITGIFLLVFITGCEPVADYDLTYDSGLRIDTRFAADNDHLYIFDSNSSSDYDSEYGSGFAGSIKVVNIASPSAMYLQQDISGINLITVEDYTLQPYQFISYKGFLFTQSDGSLKHYEILSDGLLSQATDVLTRPNMRFLLQDDIGYISYYDTVSSRYSIRVYDFSDPRNLTLSDTLALGEVNSMAAAEKKFFVCDGYAGLKVYDINRTASITVTQSEDITGYECSSLVVENNTTLQLYATFRDADIIEYYTMQYDINATPIVLLQKIYRSKQTASNSY